MAPPNTQKRVKGISIFRPFIYGTTSRKFGDKYPKPASVPEEHTHSWTVFVKGVDDSDITYWCRKVQFKLHDSYPQPLRTIENVKPGDPFELHETGWGEFEISIKIYYDPISLEKAQAVYHTVKLHPFGDESAMEKQRNENEVISWVYDEMVFNEPYEAFYEVLTNPAPRGEKKMGGKGKGGGGGSQTRVMGGGMVGSVGERTALVPLTSRPGQPFSRESERVEVRRLVGGKKKVEEMTEGLRRELKEKEKLLKELRKEAERIG